MNTLSKHYEQLIEKLHRNFNTESHKPDHWINVTFKNLRMIDELSDFDRTVYVREFSGRMTKERYKKLSHICRYYSQPPKYRCGHDYDCCGCLCGQYMTFTYKYNQVVITLVQDFNY